MIKFRILAVILVVLMVLGASAQIKESFVGQKGSDYIACYVNLPMSDMIPLGLDTILSRQLFRTSNITVKDAYQGYKKQFDKTLTLRENWDGSA